MDKVGLEADPTLNLIQGRAAGFGGDRRVTGAGRGRRSPTPGMIVSWLNW